MEKRLIFYAEDDADDRFIFEDAFFNYRDRVEIRDFRDGLELINYLHTTQNTPPSLIVLDINMPRLDGRETLRILRRHPAFSHTPIALLTTSSLDCDAEFARKHNAMFFTKSMNHSQMQRITSQLLAYCEAAVQMADDDGLSV